MLSFLGTFSDSFLLAILAWPFVAMLMTLPVLVIQYRRYNHLIWHRVAGVYLFILYSLALVSFTLYPMPDNPTVFCQDYQLSPQLNPLAFIADIREDGFRAILQITMNFIFFLPLGVFARLLLRWRLLAVLGVSLGVSLLIETAQLTGVFGAYPCSYRLFDIDDLIINTLGGVVGYVLAMVLPQKELKHAEHSDVIRQAGLLRHLVAFLIDQAVAQFVTIITLLALYFTLGKDFATDVNQTIYIIMLVVIYGIGPLVAGGRSIGGFFTRLNHDDRMRSDKRRFVFYAGRAGLVCLLLAGNSTLSLLITLVILFAWFRWKKLPHQFI